MKRKQTIDTIFTDETAISFYLLGAFMTDGNIYIDKKGGHCISIASADKDWLEHMQKLIVPTANIRQNQNCYELRFRSKLIKDWLISYGCVPRKSSTMELFRVIPKEYKYDFIRGIIDGDGCISISHQTKQLKSEIKTYRHIGLYITCGSYKFAKQLQSIINEELECSVYQKNRKAITMKSGKIIPPTIYWYVQADGTKAIQIIQKAYYSNNPISLKRKENLAANTLK